MGKYASRESTGTVVTWGDITGKPSTFAPTVHDNTAHSLAYAPIANPTFTGKVSYTPAANGSVAAPYSTDIFYGTGAAGTTGITHLNSFNDDFGSWLQFKVRNSAGLQLTAMTLDNVGNVIANRGLHIGGTSDPGDNNLLVDGNATAGAFKTTNFTILQSGTDLLIQYNGTTVFKLSSAGYLRVANEMEPHAAL